MKRPKPKAIYCEIESERLVVLFDDFKAQESYCDHLEKRMTELEGKLNDAYFERLALKKKLEEAQEILKIGEGMRE